MLRSRLVLLVGLSAIALALPAAAHDSAKVEAASARPDPGAAAAPTEARVTLAGTTRMTGSRTTSAPVRIPRTLRLEPSQFKQSLRISGAGRAIGFVLVQEGRPATARTMISAMRLSFCGRPGCSDPEPLLTAAARTAEDKGRLVIPAGHYRMYLIADGRPATVAVRLPGLSGSAWLRPTRPATPGVQTPVVAQSFQQGENQHLQSGGVEFDLRATHGLGLFAIQADTRYWLGGGAGVCVYDGPPPAAPLAYAPGCPVASAHMGYPDLFQNLFGIDLKRAYLSYTDWSGPGRKALGGYFTAAGEARNVTAVAVNLDFREVQP